MLTTVSKSIELRVNLADSAIAAALKQERVESSLLHMEFCGPRVAHAGFKPMIRNGAFNAGELAIITLMQAKCHGMPWVLLPATMVGRFQHRGISYNAHEGDLTPKDLEGRKVGMRSYSQTTGVWIRGVLQHQFGVDLGKVFWAAHDDPHVAEAPDPATIGHFSLDGRTLGEMLADGAFAAAILGAEPPPAPHVRPLIPDADAAALAWHRETGAVQINHMFVVHSEVAARPDIVREIYRLLLESKRLAPASEGIDCLPFGYDAVRGSLEIAAQYAFEQQLIPRRIAVDELFNDFTASLGR